MVRACFHLKNVLRTICVTLFAALFASTAAAKPVATPSICTRLVAKVHNDPNIMSKSVNRLLPDVKFYAFGTLGVSSSDCRKIWQKIRQDMGVSKTNSRLRAQYWRSSCPTDHSGPVFLQHLAGTRVYMGGAFEGSGSCMNAAFVETSRRSLGHLVIKTIAAPQGYTSPCIGRMGGLGEVMGVPSYVESGDVPGATLDYFIRVTPWTGHNWGRACKVTFHWHYQYRGKVQYCAPHAPCRAAKAASAELARRYIAYQRAAERRGGYALGKSVPDLDQAATSAQGLLAVARAWRILSRQCSVRSFPAYMCARYPTRKGGEKLYSTFKLFPLRFGRRLYIGGIGHLGAGRAYPPILFSVYALPRKKQNKLDGLVGIWIKPCCATGAPSHVVTYGEEAIAP